jgi:hypothetical protein
MLSPGARFGRYVIERQLGQGGMGVVYQAVDDVLGRRVALKLLRLDRAVDEAGRQRAAAKLLAEARAAATLEHANAVRVFDVGEVDGTHFIAMELVVGRSLRTFVGDASISLATRSRWLASIARALAAAHARGLVHRDVKPENVMVADDGTIKVLDFGIAALSSGDPSRGALEDPGRINDWLGTFSSADGAFVGTPRYMAPEQIVGGPLDGRADQFAWGVLAYELLSGKPPWMGESLTAHGLFDLLSRAPTPLRKLAPEVSPELEALVHRAISKAPETRFPSMESLLPTLERAARPPRPGRAMGWMLALAAIAGVGGAFLLDARNGRPSASRASASAAPPTSVASAVTAAASEAPPASREGFEREPPLVALSLDASVGVEREGDEVIRWLDQSGLGNDARAGKHRPRWIADAIAHRPVLRFAGGAALRIADATPLRIGTRDYAIEVVARNERKMPTDPLQYNLNTGYGLLLSKQDERHPYAGFGLFVNYPQPQPSSRFGAQSNYLHFALSRREHLDDGRFHLFGAWRHGNQLEARIDGVREGAYEGAPDDVSAIGRPVFIGAQEEENGAIQQLFGDIAEVVVVRQFSGAAYLTDLEAHLLAKYGLPAPAR